MNPLKQRLAKGELITAAWAEMGSADSAELMVYAGFDTIVIDGEHGIGYLDQWMHMARAVEAAGGNHILRLPSGDPTLIKRVLDHGFRSLIIPMVNTVEEARVILDAAIYPGHGGGRGYGSPLGRTTKYSINENYLAESRDDLFLMLQCEHHIAVDNLKDIAALDGVDMIFVGPNDLAGSIGYLRRLGEKPVQDLLERIEITARENNIALASITGARGNWAECRDKGYRLLAGPADVLELVNAIRKAAAERDAQLA